MGTRSITTIIDNQWEQNKPEKLCTMYRQYDGYPSGHGKELFNFLSKAVIVNGFGGKPPRGKFYANGAGCLAAMIVAHFKKDTGGIYMTAPRVKLDGEDYGYEVTVTPQLTIHVTVRSYRKVEFKGTLHEFGIFCNKEE